MEVYNLEHWNIAWHLKFWCGDKRWSNYEAGVAHWNANMHYVSLWFIEKLAVSNSILNIFICFPRLPLFHGMKLKYAGSHKYDHTENFLGLPA